jgi:hypothetical protein
MTLYRGFLLLCGIAILATAHAVSQTAGDFDSDVELRVFTELNQARTDAGAPALNLDPKLTDGARKHSALMAQHKKLSHQFPGEPVVSERLRAAGAYFTATAENAGVNSDPENITAMFLASPGHKTNLLNPLYKSAGIGVVHSGTSYWITEDFADEITLLSPEEAANQVVSAFESKGNRVHPRPLKRVNIPSLHALACETAARGKLQRKPVVLGSQEARQVLAFSTPKPSSLPDFVNSVFDLPHLQMYAVAACTPQESADNAHYWIVMAFF